MPGARVGRALVHPAGHLDQRAQADDGLVPPHLAGLDRDRRLALVAADEPAGQHPAEHPDERPLPARHAQRRLAELQRGEPDVVRPRREQRGAPVEHGHPVAVGEQVERVQVAVADDVRGRPGRVVRAASGPRRPGPDGRTRRRTAPAPRAARPPSPAPRGAAPAHRAPGRGRARAAAPSRWPADPGSGAAVAARRPGTARPGRTAPGRPAPGP